MKDISNILVALFLAIAAFVLLYSALSLAKTQSHYEDTMRDFQQCQRFCQIPGLARDEAYRCNCYNAPGLR